MKTAPLPEPGLERHTPRVLVVDDQPANIQALYQVFSDDCQVLMATGGEQALKLVLADPPDLVLLDVMMEGMDGYEVCRRLKADPVTRDIPVIFVTAHDDEAAETQALELGAVDFISKPINAKIVQARVRTHLTLKTQADLLRQWAYLDGLTGVRNRRYFDEQLANEWARAMRNGSDLSVVLLDVDCFKHYNDRYGHLAGDACLRRVAQCTRQATKRAGDMVARYGGEEFVCLLPETPLLGALAFARQVECDVIALAIEHANSPVADVVTVSLGVCTLPGNAGASAAALMLEADRQLYLAKTLGRNQVCGAELGVVV